MDWQQQRKAAGLTAAVNSAFTGGRSILLPLPAGQLCFYRRSTLPRAAQGKEWNGSSSAAVNPAAALSGRPIGNTAQGSAAGRRYTGIDGGGQSGNSALGKEWAAGLTAAGRRRSIR